MLTNISVILLIYTILIKHISGRGSYLALDKFESCEGTLHTPIIYHPATIFVSGGDTVVNYNVTVKRTITTDLDSTWVVEKCANRESLDSCSQFYKMKSRTYCNFLEARGEIWTTFIDCTTPRWECPFKAGVYMGKNCKLDVSLFRIFPLTKSQYWRIKIILNDVKKKEMVSCVLVSGALAKL